MKYKVIVQLTSADDAVIKGAASQINNLLKALDGAVAVELVCHGQSLPFVLNSGDKWSDLIHQLLEKNVVIAACENMLNANGKKSADLFPGVITVPAAIAEIVIKQQEGWSYVKAG